MIKIQAKISTLIAVAGILLITSCNVNREIVINEDGSGTTTTEYDMGDIIGLAKMSGQDFSEQMGDAKKTDTTMSLDQRLEGVEGLTEEQLAFSKSGTLNVKTDIENEVMKFGLKFPFKALAELNGIEKKVGELMSKIAGSEMQKQLDGAGEDAPPMPTDEIKMGGVDEYFTLSYTNGKISRTLNKEKYALLDEDKALQQMKEMGTMGIPVTNKLVLKLPRAAKAVTGKSVKLSDDKKTVTITDELSAFFEDGTSFDFSVEY